MRTDQPKPAAESAALLVPGFAGLAALAALWTVLQVGTRLADGHWGSTAHLVDLLTGAAEWTPWHTAAAVAVGLLFVAMGVWATVVVVKRRTAVKHVDRKAGAMGDPAGLSKAAAVRRATEGRMYREGTDPGLMFGQSVSTGQDLWSYWRDGMVIEMGPGSGKTTGIAVPLIVDAPGVVVATSNKRDLADAVRATCAARGTCWVFDPQRINNYHGARPAWWWNPLEQIHGPVEANALARVFADASAPADASKHSYFDNAGPALLGNLILAAACGGHQLDQVYLWVADPSATDREAVPLLKANGFTLPAAALKGACKAAPDERSGLFGTAAAAVAFLTSPEILAWVTDAEGRPQFDPDKFVTSGHDTLISLSREGVGTAGPLTTALTVAVMTAAERMAQRHAHGRLPVPLVAVLDEVANVCRWSGLPGQFSHYGSAGIFLVAILQNWAQGVGAWKPSGMQQMWDAATIRLVGAGIADRQHLGDVAQFIGETYKPRRTAGTSTGDRFSRSVNTSFDRELILSVDELAGLPAGRMIVLPAGGYPILGRTVPWFRRPAMTGQVTASIAANEPK